jgi:hypothetical protein
VGRVLSLAQKHGYIGTNGQLVRKRERIVFVFMVLEIKPRASQMLGKCSTTRPHPQPRKDVFYFNIFHKTGTEKECG